MDNKISLAILTTINAVCFVGNYLISIRNSQHPYRATSTSGQSRIHSNGPTSSPSFDPTMPASFGPTRSFQQTRTEQLCRPSGLTRNHHNNCDDENDDWSCRAGDRKRKCGARFNLNSCQERRRKKQDFDNCNICNLCDNDSGIFLSCARCQSREIDNILNRAKCTMSKGSKCKSSAKGSKCKSKNTYNDYRHDRERKFSMDEFDDNIRDDDTSSNCRSGNPESDAEITSVKHAGRRGECSTGSNSCRPRKESCCVESPRRNSSCTMQSDPVSSDRKPMPEPMVKAEEDEPRWVKVLKRLLVALFGMFLIYVLVCCFSKHDDSAKC